MIGLYDSGSGGLTILQTLRQHFPTHDFLYYGDHANAPLGHRKSEDIVNLTKQGVTCLMNNGCGLVILACNTAAAVALRSLQQNWLPDHFPENRILGVLVPMVEQVTGVPWHMETPGNLKEPDLIESEHRTEPSIKSVLLFATTRTVTSGAYRDEIKKRAPALKLYQKACPGLVDAIEGGAGDKPLAGIIHGYVREALEDMDHLPDAVVLGCTHFPLVHHHFVSALPKAMPLFSQPAIVADSLSDYLRRHPEFDQPGTSRLFLKTTGEPATIGQLNSLLPAELIKFEKIS